MRSAKLKNDSSLVRISSSERASIDTANLRASLRLGLRQLYGGEPDFLEVREYDEPLVAEALRREAARGGQSFFLHNRVETIREASEMLRGLVPELRFLTAHGQMAEHELEGVIQVANFHPAFLFEGEAQDDPSHFTNRAPYPTLHLLREDSVERAVASDAGDAEKIVERNIATLRELGAEGWKALLKP